MRISGYLLRVSFLCLLTGLVIACSSQEKVARFCDQNYPIIFDHPESWEVNDTMGLHLGNGNALINVGIYEANLEISAETALQKELSNSRGITAYEEYVQSVESLSVSDKEAVLAVFENYQSPSETRWFPTSHPKYYAVVDFGNRRIHLVAFIYRYDDEALNLETRRVMEQMIGTLQVKDKNNDCRD